MRKIYLILFLVSSFAGFSQEDAWVYFKDKPDSQTYLDNPLTMLTQRALDRRTNQGIALDSKDVPVYQLYIDQVAASAGITVKAKSKWFNCVHVRGTQANITAVKLLPFVDKVDFANKNLTDLQSKLAKPKGKLNPVNTTSKTAANFNYGTSANQIQMLNGHLLHQSDYTGSGKIIAVMDGGFPGVNTAAPFARLRDNNLILGGYDYVNRNTNFYSGVSHGTSVLSLMGGYVENSLIGTAPDASYYLFITEDDANENPVELSNWVEAAEEADRLGVDIITTSLGYNTFDDAKYDFTYNDMNGTSFMAKGVDAAFSRGIVCVVSAGNEGNKPWKYITTPADAVNALTVGAVKADETYAVFSSIGPTPDGRVKPDVMAQGQNPYLSNDTGIIFNTGSGTSYACPILAGMVACLWQALPGKTNQEIKQLITQSADRYAAPTPQLGYGVPDFNAAVANGLSVADFSKNDFVVYPNPANDFVSVNLSEGLDKGNIIFYTVLGQKVLEEKITRESASVSVKSLTAGIYFYKIESNGFSKNGKIIKQ